MIAIRGIRSEIAVQLLPMLPADEIVRDVERGAKAPMDAGRYLFCAGALHGKRIGELNDAEIAESFIANAASVIRECERLIGLNEQARICVIGSESGFAWSYDAVYAGAKAALHRYIETKKLRTAQQQLVCIAPGIIGDCGMTTRRADTRNLEARKAAHRKGRFLTAIEVARLIYHVLYIDEGYLSGITIRMNGGAHA